MSISIDLFAIVSLISTAITPNKIIAGVVLLVVIIGVAIWYVRRSKAS